LCGDSKLSKKLDPHHHKGITAIGFEQKKTGTVEPLVQDVKLVASFDLGFNNPAAEFEINIAGPGAADGAGERNARTK
jgi:hypothetical protein